MESRCKCCLQNGRHKDMWAEYINDGDVEVYGEMIKECFQFSWSNTEKYMEQICDCCIEKLRFSLDFRRDVLSSFDAWTGLLDNPGEDNGGLLKLKTEGVDEHTIEIEYDYQEEDPGQTEYVKTEGKNNEELANEEEVEYLSYNLESESSPECNMQVEYLEDDEDCNEVTTVLNSKKPNTSRKYKQYTQSDLEKALEMVINNKLTRSEASVKYNVPIKTLGFKLRNLDNEEDNEGKVKLNKFHDEIRTILTYTNATPYKTKVGRLFCAYCSTEGPMFETPDALRTHTRTGHFSERLKNVELFMRPNYLNEVIKLDIDNLQCTVCVCSIDNWNAMFEHLKEIHDVQLDLAYTKAIPYILDEDILCCLCHQKFSHFHLLDVHMNSHYNNYICGECGDTFLSENRLKKHVETHSTKKYPCTLCGKTFTLEKYRKKHFDGVHLKELKFKCVYCQEVFAQDYSRHLHVLAEHNEKVKLINCEYCGQNFTWRPYYLKHMKQNHTKPEKKFSCKLCSKKFQIKSELKHHEDWHSGKGFTCPLCHRKFSSKNYLRKHIATHGEGAGEEESVEYADVRVETQLIDVGAQNSGEVVVGK